MVQRECLKENQRTEKTYLNTCVFATLFLYICSMKYSEALRGGQTIILLLLSEHSQLS